MLSRCTDCTDLEKTMSSQDERYPIPEHDKRSLGCGLDDDIEVAYAYVESVSDTHDMPSPAGWRGWALRRNFWRASAMQIPGSRPPKLSYAVLTARRPTATQAGF